MMLDPKLFREFLVKVRNRCVEENFGDENAGHPKMGEWLAEVRLLDTLVNAIDAATVSQ